MTEPRSPRVAWRAVDGIVLLDKPQGLTSNGALQRVRRLFAARKAGHTGSLDPLATGMLPLCFGEATKFAGHMLDADKEYRVRLRFGTRTDTADADGVVVAAGGRDTVPATELAAVLPGFRGEIRQVPPMYSALKQGGRRLYKLARAGQELPREPRLVRVHGLEVVEDDPAAPALWVRCGKGTYIRALVEDIAAALGTLAHVVELRRLSVAPFPPDGMVTVDALQAAAVAGGLDRFLLPVDAGLVDWPRIELPADGAARIRAGRAVKVTGAAVGPGRVYGPDGRFLGVAEVGPGGLLTPRRLRAA